MICCACTHASIGNINKSALSLARAKFLGRGEWGLDSDTERDVVEITMYQFRPTPGSDAPVISKPENQSDAYC